MFRNMAMTDGADSSGGGLFSRELEPASPGAGRRRGLVVGAVLLGLLGLWLWMRGSEGGALRALSPAQRQALYQETWRDQRARCLGPERSDTPGQCQHRAEFLLRFPQCDVACRTELAPSFPSPAP
jgi:cytochrome b pre-mRNA-processing protein 3